jgi:hypothetical protein
MKFSNPRFFGYLGLSTLALVLATNCSHKSGKRGPASQEQTTTAQKAENDEIEYNFKTPEDRIDAIKKASIFRSRPENAAGKEVNPAQINIVEGPKQSNTKNKFQFNDRVTCKFTKPGAAMGGATPKYKCVITKIERLKTDANGTSWVSVPVIGQDEVKIKYGASNREIYGETIATRLFWALGYYSDPTFPITVICEDCPKDPRKDFEPAIGAIRPPEIAIIERKFKGEAMDNMGADDKTEGWTWREFGTHSELAVSLKDSLALLAAFVGHGDNKSPQQRLVCKEKDIVIDKATGRMTCKASQMMIQDLGATFGGAGKITDANTAKVNLKHWVNDDGQLVWADKDWKDKEAMAGKPCRARLKSSWSAKDGLGNSPEISEEGRRYLVSRLCQLSTKQIRDLFTVGRVSSIPKQEDEMSDEWDTNNVEHWVQIFKMKRQELAENQNCRSLKPKNLKSVVDYNYCLAQLKKLHNE